MIKEVNLIIIAMDEEFEALLNNIKDYQVEDFFDNKIYSFKFNKEYFIALRGKIGKVSTAFYIGQLSMKFNIKKIYNLGTSGAYQKSLNIGDVVIASRVGYFDVDVTGFSYPMGQVPHCPRFFESESVNITNLNFDGFKVHQGLIGSSDSFITIKNVDLFPLKELNPLCVEMEAGAVSQCAYLLKIPFIIIRSISDKIYEKDNSLDFDNNLKRASNNCVSVLLKLIND